MNASNVRRIGTAFRNERCGAASTVNAALTIHSLPDCQHLYWCRSLSLVRASLNGHHSIATLYRLVVYSGPCPTARWTVFTIPQDMGVCKHWERAVVMLGIVLKTKEMRPVSRHREPAP